MMMEFLLTAHLLTIWHTLVILMLCSAHLDSTLGQLLELLANIRTAQISAKLFDGESYEWKITKCKQLIDSDSDITFLARERLGGLLAEARIVLNERNRYAHSSFWSHDDTIGEVSAIRIRRNRPDEWTFTLADLKELVGRVARTDKGILDLIGRDYEEFADNRVSQRPSEDKN